MPVTGRTESATAPPSPLQRPGRTQVSAGEEREARQAPQGLGPPAPPASR